MIETQASLNAWADATFGPSNNIPHLLTRANLEMAELLHEITMPVPDFAKVREECADVCHILCRIAGIVDENLDDIFRISPAIIDANLYPPAARAFQHTAFLFEKLSIRNVTRQDDIGRMIGMIAIKMAEICVAAGGNIADEIDRKAAILRTREWEKDGTGCGSHARSKPHQLGEPIPLAEERKPTYNNRVIERYQEPNCIKTGRSWREPGSCGDCYGCVSGKTICRKPLGGIRTCQRYTNHPGECSDA